MIIGDRLRALREQKNLSQGHIEKRTGLLRCYLSRVECGHTVPSIETLEKWARALEVPLYQISTMAKSRLRLSLAKILSDLETAKVILPFH
jgi:transcriptional regulator with XRE-family HTH domain